MLNIQNLTKTFGNQHAVNGVNLKVPKGSFVGIIGRSGAGKSTLLRALSWMLVPEQGQVLIDGTPAGALRPADLAKAVFHVHQDPLAGSVPTMTVFENLLVADQEAHTQRLHRNALIGRYRSMLQSLDLADRLQQQAKTLSGGQRQILAILIARLRPAKVILLDEPLSALDAANSATCLKLIGELKNSGKTLVYVTHDLNEVQAFADRIVTLRDGRILSDTLVH